MKTWIVAIALSLLSFARAEAKASYRPMFVLTNEAVGQVIYVQQPIYDDNGDLHPAESAVAIARARVYMGSSSLLLPLNQLELVEAVVEGDLSEGQAVYRFKDKSQLTLRGIIGGTLAEFRTAGGQRLRFDVRTPSEAVLTRIRLNSVVNARCAIRALTNAIVSVCR